MNNEYLYKVAGSFDTIYNHLDTSSTRLNDLQIVKCQYCGKNINCSDSHIHLFEGLY